MSERTRNPGQHGGNGGRRATTLLLVTGLLGWAWLSGARAASPHADSRWRLAAAAYPAKTRLYNVAPTNANLQTLLGSVHHSTYASLGRLDGRGWLQDAELIHAVHRRANGGGVTELHRLFWVYAVSYYPSAQAAQAAAADLTFPLGPATGGVQMATSTTEDGVYSTYAVAQVGPFVVEQVCDMKPGPTGLYRQQLDAVCTQQRIAVLTRLSLTATVSPTAAVVAVTPGSPAPTATATAAPTATP